MVSRSLHGLVAAVLLLQAGCAGFRTCGDSWLGPDKAKHFAAGFVLGAGGALAARDLGPEEAAGIGWTAAMAAGLPIAATEASRALVADCGLTAPYGDVSAFSDVLKRLLEDDTLRETLGNRAARRRFPRF